ncbi:MAG: HepT-like ribonuclease domain-containing protein [Euryarchaeota archaeon]|nr:HepT-like ribonuclease domain-containing protein [Euryarchaeota archaeon]
MRNIIVHRYDKIDIEIIKEALGRVEELLAITLKMTE